MSIGFQLKRLDTNFNDPILNLHFSMKDWVMWQNKMQWKTSKDSSLMQIMLF